MPTNQSFHLVSESRDLTIAGSPASDLRIGRSEENEVSIDSKSVSRWHAKISCENAEFILQDMGSKNGTYLNGLKVSGAVPIREGDALRIGDAKFVFREGLPTDENRFDAGKVAGETVDGLAPASIETTDAKLLQRMKAGDRDAANKIIATYFDRVARAARRRLKQRRLRATDSQDIAASVFESLWKKIDNNQLGEDNLTSTDEFWRLLSAMVRFKTENHVRREFAAKRGGGAIRGESVFAGPNQVEGAGIEGQAIEAFDVMAEAEFKDQYQQMMNGLGDVTLQEIVTLRMEGHKVDEIAKHFQKSDRWVKRKLAEIRERWIHLNEQSML